MENLHSETSLWARNQSNKSTDQTIWFWGEASAEARDHATYTSATLDGTFWYFDSWPMYDFMDKNTLKLGIKLVYLRIANLPM